MKDKLARIKTEATKFKEKFVLDFRVNPTHSLLMFALGLMIGGLLW